MQATAWRPIVEGADRERARAALDSLRACGSEPAAAWVPDGTSAEVRAAFDASLASGAAGQAIFHGARALVDGDEARSAAVRCLAFARETVATAPMGPDLYSGFTGIAWASARLEEGLPEDEAGEDPLDEIDATLLSMLEHGALPRHFDLVNGLTGLAVYALERLPRPSARELLSRIVLRLEERAEPVAGGRAWRTPPEFADPERGHGPFDLGVAHGLAGPIAVLAGAAAWDVEAKRARRLLADAVGVLGAARLDGGEGLFPATTGEGARREPARLAWCYGDAGIAAALQAAADVLHDASLAALAREAGLSAAQRTLASSGVRDAGFCHGAAGLSHVFHRLHHATGEAHHAEAARTWFSRALDFRRPGESGAGFSSAIVGDDGEVRGVVDPGVLRGAAGIGLALLAATTDAEPTWDRMMLVSIRRP